MIDTPASTLLWEVGESVSFTGHASDPEQGTLPASSLSWTLLMQHCPSNCHSHTIQSWPGVASGSFSAPDHEYPSYLELQLTATDAGGASGSTTLRLDPATVTLTFETSPSGLQLSVNGTSSATPFTRTVIEGSNNSLSAPSPQSQGGTSYGFTSWSDGGAQSHNIVASTAVDTYTASYASQPSGSNAVADFDGDGDTDLSVFRPSQGGWYMQGQPPFPQIWGASGDLSVSADYDGDGSTRHRRLPKRALVRQGQPPYPQIWGQAGDVPVPADYDGDGDADIAVFRNGHWYVQGQPPYPQIWGQAGDVPVPADYDGDGDADIAVFRNGHWYVQGQPPYPQIWGQAGDVPVPADYDGDGDADIAVFRNGHWYVQGQPPFPQIWGQAGDVPVPGDYDGDGDADIAVFRDGHWYVQGPASLPADLGCRLRHPAAASLCASHASSAEAVPRAEGLPQATCSGSAQCAARAAVSMTTLAGMSPRHRTGVCQAGVRVPR